EPSCSRELPGERPVADTPRKPPPPLPLPLHRRRNIPEYLRRLFPFDGFPQSNRAASRRPALPQTQCCARWPRTVAADAQPLATYQETAIAPAAHSQTWLSARR